MFELSNRRYTGSKTKLKDWIKEIVLKYNGEGKSFCDLFAGTGIISQTMIDEYNHIIINDYLMSNEIIYYAFFAQEDYDWLKINEYANLFKNINPKKLKENYVSKSYGGKYFTNEDAKKIGYIREKIEKEKDNFTKKEFSILVASLIYSFDRTANTVGHYDAYFKKNNHNRAFKFELIKPISMSKNKSVDIYREDANILVRKINCDIIYIDPPYSSRQYNRFYHVIENIVKWNKPTLYGVARKPKANADENSEYCKVKAPIVFADLIENINAKTILVSYNNTYNSKSSSSKNKMTFKEIQEILNKKGKTNIYSKSHRPFNAGTTNFSDHKEYLFITKVGIKNE